VAYPVGYAIIIIIIIIIIIMRYLQALLSISLWLFIYYPNFVQGRLTYFLASLVLRLGIELFANAMAKLTSHV